MSHYVSYHSLVSVNINWFNLRILGNVLGIIGTFLENYGGLFESLRIALAIGQKNSIIYLPLLSNQNHRQGLIQGGEGGGGGWGG